MLNKSWFSSFLSCCSEQGSKGSSFSSPGLLCKKKTAASAGPGRWFQSQKGEESLQWWLWWWQLRLHREKWGEVDGPLWDRLFNRQRILWPGNGSFCICSISLDHSYIEFKVLLLLHFGIKTLFFSVLSSSLPVQTLVFCAISCYYRKHLIIFQCVLHFTMRNPPPFAICWHSLLEFGFGLS